MSPYAAPLGEIGFLLRKVAGLEDILALSDCELDSETVDQILGEAARFAAAELAPLQPVGDRRPAVLDNGVVRTPPGFREAYAKFVAAGWNGLVFPEEWGGQNLPWLVNSAVAEMWNAANMTFELCPLLTQAGVEALLHHGTAEQKRLSLPRLVSGEWTGAMCLTEPQAGSDVGALRTRAEREGAQYRIRGQKIVITFGDHDLAENIVHFVLARLPGAPSGTRGLSLFLVPKFLPGPDGTPGRRNDWRCIKLEEKLGIHGSPTCVISYGDEEGATGYLLGEENRGMQCMFTMMNNARIAVGIEGLGIAERAYQQASAYARERVQGKWKGRPAAIFEYPDVRRMLMTQRAYVSASRALCYVVTAEVDRSLREKDAERRARAFRRVALLTPIVKAWCTDRACEIASLALQVHGGMGYIEETGIAQLYRDVRITPIYEGTNGIQAWDLVGRKLSIEDGRLPWELFSELREDLELYKRSEEGERVVPLERGLLALERATQHLQERDPEERQAAATPYLQLFGHVLGGFLLARAAHHAASDPAGAAFPGIARYFLDQLLPSAVALETSILADPGQLDSRWLAGPN